MKQLFAFFSAIRFTVGYILTVIFLPILGANATLKFTDWNSPLYPLLNGIFVGLTKVEIFFSIFLVSWLVFLIVLLIGLMLDSYNNRFAKDPTAKAFLVDTLFDFRLNLKKLNDSPDQIPRVLFLIFGLPFSLHNWIVWLLLTAPTFWTTVNGSGFIQRIGFAGLGLIATLATVSFSWGLSRGVLHVVGERLGKVFRYFGFDYIVSDNKPLLAHLFMIVAFLFTFGLFWFIKVTGLQSNISALSSVTVLLTILFCFFGFFSFHFPRKLSTSFTPWFLLVLALLAITQGWAKLVVIVVCGVMLVWLLNGFGIKQWWGKLLLSVGLAAVFILLQGKDGISMNDYRFEVSQIPSPNVDLANATLTPNEIVGERNTIVVVAVMGGGIKAASWSTFVLDKLYKEIPQLEDHVRLLSGVSGGSVGIANYLYCLYAESQQSSCGSGDSPMMQAHLNARKSSLNDAAYALAFGDVSRFLLPFKQFRILDHGVLDRGQALQQRWEKNARGESTVATPKLSELVGLIKDGTMPAFILNTTALETGQRIMITPIRFLRSQPVTEFSKEGNTRYGDTRVKLERAKTLWEYLTADPKLEASSPGVLLDTDLWTAARLSATFSYVTPPAVASIGQQNLCQVLSKNAREDEPLESMRCGHHFIDGGYHDNFGVMSVLDVLSELLSVEATRQQLDNIVIIHMRMSNFDSLGDPQGSETFVNEIAGPPLGIFNIFDKGNRTRNDIALAQFKSYWNLLAEENLGPKITLVEIVPDLNVPGPLSWHLTFGDMCRLDFPGIEKVHCPPGDKVDVVDLQGAIDQINSVLNPINKPIP